MTPTRDMSVSGISTASDRSYFSARSLRDEDEHRARKLILTLSHDQLVEEITAIEIEQKFAQFEFAVKIEKMNDRGDKYIVTFESENCKRQAHELKDELGFNLVKKRTSRPSPNNPVVYRALCPQKISDGKALFKAVVGEVNKDDILIVNTIKGLRARVAKINNGVKENRGWVTLLSDTGEALLERVW